jgi:hypothetical protein
LFQYTLEDSIANSASLPPTGEISHIYLGVYKSKAGPLSSLHDGASTFSKHTFGNVIGGHLRIDIDDPLECFELLGAF